MRAEKGWLSSALCKEFDLLRPEFQEWARAMKENPSARHRKLWEYAFICQALAERGLLEPDRRGLGFAVGREPLPALFAARGCEIVASDMASDLAKKIGWVDTAQHAADLAALNSRALCPPDAFASRVTFRTVDMNRVPADLTGFDFVWSACSLEHLGSIAAGERFIGRSLNCLKVGGIAVHTTEFNLSSNQRTIDNRGTVLFRRRDVERIAARLRLRGHAVDLDLTEGTSPIDRHVDVPPYTHDPHLRLALEGYVTTSVGLIVRKGQTSRSVATAVRYWRAGWDVQMALSAVGRATLGVPRRVWRSLRR